MSAGDDDAELRRQREVADRDRAAISAGFVVEAALEEYPQIRVLPQAVVARLAVQVTLAYLIGHDLISVRSAESWPAWVAASIPEHLKPNVMDTVERWTLAVRERR